MLKYEFCWNELKLMQREVFYIFPATAYRLSDTIYVWKTYILRQGFEVYVWNLYAKQKTR
jgi:hypothetical protein